MQRAAEFSEACRVTIGDLVVMVVRHVHVDVGLASEGLQEDKSRSMRSECNGCDQAVALLPPIFAQVRMGEHRPHKSAHNQRRLLFTF